MNQPPALVACISIPQAFVKMSFLWAYSSAGRAFGSHPRGRGFESLWVHQRQACCASLSFLCRDIYQRLLTCSLILALCCHCAELLKGNIKFNLQCVISIDINRFDKLGNNHLLGSKITVIIEVSPGLYLLILFPLYISVRKMMSSSSLAASTAASSSVTSAFALLTSSFRNSISNLLCPRMTLIPSFW